MPVRPLSEIVQARLAADPQAAKAVRREGIRALMRGELKVGWSLLRDYVSAACRNLPR